MELFGPQVCSNFTGIPNLSLTQFFHWISQAFRDDMGPRPKRDPCDGGGFHVAGCSAALARVGPSCGFVVDFGIGVN